MANNIKGLTVEIGGNTGPLADALADVTKKSRNLSSELGDINRLLRLDPGNTELLAQKQKILADAISNTGEKLEKLKTAEKQVQEQFKRGEVSEAQVRALQREIVATEQKMGQYEQAAKETERALSGLDDETREVEESSGNLGATLANVAKTGFAAVTAAVGAAITGLVAAAETTRDYRAEMGKLDSAYIASGLSTEAAATAYKTLVGVIGETDQAVEAAQQIALLANSTEDVAKWSELAAGVTGRFGDALMPETFFEAANETIKLNEAAGAYVQLLEGTGYSVDKFNAGLAAATTAEEKQAYMLQVTKELLGAAGESYKEMNGDIIRANQANDAWMQSLSGVGAAVDPIVTDVKLMAASMLSEAVPAVQQLADAFRGLLNGDAGASGQFGAAISGLITGIVQKLTEMLPTVLQVAVSIITTLASGLGSQLPLLLTTAGQIITQFVAGIQTYLPIVLAKGAEILGNLGEGIRQNFPGLVSRALDVIMQFAATIYDNAPKLIQIGFDLLSDVVAGVLSALPVLLAKGPEIISKFANVINDNFPTILAKGVQLIGQIIMGIIQAIPTLVANIPKIITAIVDVWEAFNWLNLGKKAITFLKDGVLKMVGAVKSAGTSVMEAAVNAVKNLPQNLLNLGKSAVSDLGGAIRNGVSTAKSAASSVMNAIVDGVKNLPSKMLSIGSDLVRGLWNGISDMTGWIIGKIGGFTNSVVSRIKGFFGIKSPSRVFRDEVGKNLALGLAEGVDNNADAPIDSMESMARGILDSAKGLDGISLERTLQHKVTTAQAAAAAYPSDIIGKLDKILTAIEKGQILTIDKNLLVGGTANDYDSALGKRRELIARGAL